MTRKAVIVGRGVISPAGRGVAALWQAARDGSSCVRAEDHLDLEGLPMARVSARLPDAVIGDLATRHGNRRRSDAELLLWDVVAQALEEGRVERDARADTVLLTTQLPESGFERTDSQPGYGQVLRDAKATPAARIPREGLGSSWIGDLSQRLGAELRVQSMHATCATGLRLVCEAARLIELGRTERVVVAVLSRPVDALHVAAFGRALALSRWDGAPAGASRPFDQERSGFVFGEAAGALVIESEELARARQAPKLGRILGWGLAMNHQHFLRTSLKHMVMVQRAALQKSGRDARHVDLFDAMGSSSQVGDADEARSIHRVLGERLPELRVSACKSVLGYSSQASAVAELIVSTCAASEGVAPPVPTCERQEPEIELPLLRTAHPANIDLILKHAFGMGGHYAALVLERMG